MEVWQLLPEVAGLESEQELAGCPLGTGVCRLQLVLTARAPARAQAYSLEEAAAMPDGVGAQGTPEGSWGTQYGPRLVFSALLEPAVLVLTA